jgi:hypothetical protein
MDESLRIGPWSIGLDGFLGLIPGVGDMAGGAVSAFMIGRAMQAGVSRAAIIRMVMNAGVDSLLGSLPFLGDIFDFAFKANTKNLQIYREALRGERRPVKDWAFISVVVLLMAIIIILPILGLIFLVKLLTPYLPTF